MHSLFNLRPASATNLGFELNEIRPGLNHGESAPVERHDAWEFHSFDDGALADALPALAAHVGYQQYDFDSENRISVRFEYEWQSAKTGQWFRTHGNEHWEFDADGYMSRRDMSANDIPITADDRRISI